MIEFRNVDKTFGGRDILRDVSLTVECGEFFVLVGMSGAGKTTILKMMNRLVEPDSGEILFQDRKLTDWDLRELRLNIGYVLQQGALFPNLTVGENIGLIPGLKEWDKAETEKEAKRLLALVGLDPAVYYDRYPRQLSGGEKQRVGILRAIITKPRLLLMDEPFSALDPIIRRDLQKLIRFLHEELEMTVAFVTHDMREAMLLADRIGIVENGRVVQVDTPADILKRPADAFVRKLFESEDLL